MKKKLIIFSAILLISVMVAGGTFAWFTSSPDPLTMHMRMGIVKVEVIQNGLENISVKSITVSLDMPLKIGSINFFYIYPLYHL